MEKLTMCRICLATDLRINSILNTHLQDIYEKLTSIQFETKDSRPILACYLCCARLQNCYQLSMNCLRSEELLTQMLNGKMANPTNLQDINRHMRLVTTPVMVETIEDLLYDVDRQLLVDPTPSSAVDMELKMVVNGVLEDKVPAVCIKEEPGIYDTFQTEDGDEVPLDIVKHEIEITGIPILEDKPVEKTENNSIMIELTPLNERSTDTKEIKSKTNSNNKEKLKKCIKSKTSDAHVNKPYFCSYCPKAFARRAHLTRHTYSHTGEKPLKCNHCEKSFTSKSSLSHHVVQNHTHQKPFPCNKCDEGFMVKLRLNKHIVSEHVDWIKFICEYCSEDFKSKLDLQIHVGSNHGEKPFKCELCSNSYARHCDLIRHNVTHQGKKEYKCDICPKRYTRRRYYTIHYRIHTGEKPYKCDLCKKSFRAKTHVLKHIRNHSKIKI